MSSEFWNNRYNAGHYVYGTEPNAFYKEQIEKLIPGNILFPFEGEGRNSVYAATLGWNVTAFDQSDEGRKKALKLAEQNNVVIEYLLGEWQNTNINDNYFDAVVLVFAHPHYDRDKFHQFIKSKLKPNGTLILEAYSKEQLKYGTGGPKDEYALYSEEEIKNDFSDMTIISLGKKIVELKEGDFHEGESSVIRLVARK